MTQKEAVKKALEMLGGRAKMHNICLIAADLIGTNTRAQNVENNVRRVIYSNPRIFRPSPGREGWWELISYQEELVALKQEITELKAQLAEKDKAIEEMKAIKTADDFVRELTEATKEVHEVHKNNADPVRQVLVKLGRKNEASELSSWIKGKDKKQEKKGSQKIVQKISNSQVFNGEITGSDFNAGGQGHE